VRSNLKSIKEIQIQIQKRINSLTKNKFKMSSDTRMQYDAIYDKPLNVPVEFPGDNYLKNMKQGPVPDYNKKVDDYHKPPLDDYSKVPIDYNNKPDNYYKSPAGDYNKKNDDYNKIPAEDCGKDKFQIKDPPVPIGGNRRFGRWAAILCVVVVIIVVAIVVPIEILGVTSSGDSSNSAGIGNRVRVSGTVNTLNGAQVSDAIITGTGGEYTKTNSSGGFDFYASYSKENSVVLEITTLSQNYATQFYQIDYNPSVKHYATSISLVPFTIKKKFWLANGLKFRVPLSFNDYYNVTISASPFAKNISSVFRFAYIPAEGAPGKLQTILENAQVKSHVLQSAGMFYWDVIDSNGSYVKVNYDQLPVFHSGSVSFGGNYVNRTQESIWTFDEYAGRWTDPVPTPSTGSKLPNTVLPDVKVTTTRAGFWSVGRVVGMGCVTGTVRAPNGLPAEGVEVYAWDLDNANTFQYGHSQEEGLFCLEGPTNWNAELQLGPDSRNQQFPNYPGTCAKPTTCLDLGKNPLSSNADFPVQEPCTEDVFKNVKQCTGNALVGLQKCLANEKNPGNDDDSVHNNDCYCTYYKSYRRCTPEYLEYCCVAPSPYSGLCDTILATIRANPTCTH
jgi:hypothetical protein